MSIRDFIEVVDNLDNVLINLRKICGSINKASANVKEANFDTKKLLSEQRALQAKVEELLSKRDSERALLDKFFILMCVTSGLSFITLLVVIFT